MKHAADCYCFNCNYWRMVEYAKALSSIPRMGTFSTFARAPDKPSKRRDDD